MTQEGYLCLNTFERSTRFNRSMLFGRTLKECLADATKTPFVLSSRRLGNSGILCNGEFLTQDIGPPRVVQEFSWSDIEEPEVLKTYWLSRKGRDYLNRRKKSAKSKGYGFGAVLIRSSLLSQGTTTAGSTPEGNHISGTVQTSGDNLHAKRSKDFSDSRPDTPQDSPKQQGTRCSATQSAFQCCDGLESVYIWLKNTTPCAVCGEPWCLVHDEHWHDCECPGADDCIWFTTEESKDENV